MLLLALASYTKQTSSNKHRTGNCHLTFKDCRSAADFNLGNACYLVI